MISWVWPVAAWPANDRDENSDDIDPKYLVGLAAVDEGGAGGVGGTVADADVDEESILSDIGDA